MRDGNATSLTALIVQSAIVQPVGMIAFTEKPIDDCLLKLAVWVYAHAIKGDTMSKREFAESCIWVMAFIIGGTAEIWAEFFF